MNNIQNKNASDLEDLKVIAEVLSGNKQAYAKLIKKYQQKLYNLAFRITHNSEDSMDITQESFLKAYYSLNKFDSSRPFIPWLMKITHNTALSCIKKRKTVVDIDKLKHVLSSNDENDKRLFMEHVVNSLPEDYRIIIELRHYQDLSYEAIADQVNLSVPAVKSKLFRARKQIQKMFRSMS